MLKWLIAFTLALLLVAGLSQAGEVLGPVESGGGGDSGPSVSPGSGGGGSRQIDINGLLKAVKDGKKSKPAVFEELKTILWKNPITNESYKKPMVLMYYKGNNTTVNRNQRLEIITVVKNNNPLEMRRMLDLYLEVKEPGSDKYEPINTWPEKIQTNEYDKTNTTLRIWGMLPSFSYLKKVGEVKVRANVSDGVNKWSTITSGYSGFESPYYSELVFNVTNSLPKMSNFNVTPSGLVRYNDPIEYKADIADADGDMLNVTLHILDKDGKEEVTDNKTLEMKPGTVSFKANEYGFFKEADAGKNFTYYYSFDDGINSAKTEIMNGPYIRKGPKLSVDKLDFSSSSTNYYWWEKYGFNVRAKNLNPEVYNVTFTLSTRSGNNEWTTVETKTVKIGPDPVELHFNDTRPFQVTDAGQTFYYKVKYSEYDQSGKDAMEQTGVQINGKIMPYKMRDPVMLANLLPMLLFIVVLGLLMERKLKRGIEAQESSSGNNGKKKRLGSGKSSQGALSGIINKISAIFRRKN
jgi:hypothetical protein